VIGLLAHTALYLAITGTVPVDLGDAQWSNTAALLHCETNTYTHKALIRADQPNNTTTFTDETGNTWTAGGTAKIVTTNKKYGMSSMYFDGSVNCCYTGPTNFVGIGTQDFTFEAWVYPTKVQDTTAVDANDRWIFGGWNTANGCFVVFLGSQNYQLQLWDGYNANKSIVAVRPFMWNHVAIVRKSNTLYFFVNGVLGNTIANYTTSFVNQTGTWIGGEKGVSSRWFSGYIDSVRWITGTGLYTTDFTPPLREFDYTVAKPTDEVGNRWNLSGSSSHVYPSPTWKMFGSTSYYFDGAGTNYLYTTDVAALNSSDYTVEGFFCLDQLSTSYIRTLWSNYDGNQSHGRILLTVSTNNTLNFGEQDSNGNNSSGGNTTVTVAANTTYHFACVKQGTTCTLYLNGVNVLQFTSVARTQYTNMLTLGIFDYTSGTYNYPYKGYIDEVRVSRFARYTANFVVPAQQFSNKGKTAALLHFDGANGSTVFNDDIGSTWTANGSAALSTAQQNFGPSSGYFDGASGYISTPAANDFNLTSGDWTVECNFYCTALTSGSQSLIDKDGTFGRSFAQYDLSISSTGKLLATIGTGNGTGYQQTITGTTTVTLNTFHHTAVVRLGSTFYLYLDGGLEGSLAITGTMAEGSKPLLVGYQTGQPTAVRFNGYIDELRIVKGEAKYRTQFLPPIRAHLADASNAVYAFSDDYTTGSLGNYLDLASSPVTTWTYGAGQLIAVHGTGSSEAAKLYNGLRATDFRVDWTMTQADDSGVAVRYQDINNRYVVACYDNSSSEGSASYSRVTVYRVVAGTATQIGTSTIPTWTRGVATNFTATISGNLITVYVNGTQYLSITDSTPWSGLGRCGPRIYTGQSNYTKYKVQ